MKSSAFARSLELAKLAAKVGLKELGSKDLKSRIEQAAIIAESLSNLKGAAMKAGQLLSLELNDYFPEEAIEILSKLQSSAEPANFAIIQKVLKSQLSDEILKKIHRIDQKPIGVASIGQVHRATSEVGDIVLKVQYPGVADSVDSDLKILKTLAVSFCSLTGRNMNLDPLFLEFKNILIQELDYQQEAEFQKNYLQKISNFKSDQGFKCTVPEVISEFSTNKVLAMKYEPGILLRAWMKSNLKAQDREKMAYTFLDLYFHEFFKWGLVQTDSNYGNFLVRPRGDTYELVLLDFGACRNYDKKFISQYVSLLKAVGGNNFDEIKKIAIEFNLLDPREDEAAFIAFQEMLTTAISPFFVSSKDGLRFDFTDQKHLEVSQAASKKLINSLKFSPPPHKILFLHRKLGGVYSVLKGLGVQLDISMYWKQMQDFAMEE